MLDVNRENFLNALLVEICRKNAGVKLPGSCLTLDWVEYDTKHP